VKLLDRHILGRFFANFAILFALLYMFAVAIDLILNLDEFVDAARERLDEDASTAAFVGLVVRLMFDFQGPRFFQFFAYLHGLVAVGAVGFVLGQMHRAKELVAVMASGVSLHRIAMPFVAGMFLLSMVQLLNQELMLPRVAPLVLRGHADVGQRSVDEFAVPLTPDGRGGLVQAPSFEPGIATLVRPTWLERDERGRTVRRITADTATWDAVQKAWRLERGLAVRRSGDPAAGGAGRVVEREAVGLYATDVDPSTLIVRRHGEYAAMLSLRQITEMLERPGVVDTTTLQRHRYSRFATVLINVLVLVITLPSFLLREPTSLLRQSLVAASISLPVMLTAIIVMTVDLPGIGPAVGVFLPVIMLLPVVLARVMYIKS
jgi:lipopolysaccharide export LptBFGC system permease protein LptF